MRRALVTGGTKGIGLGIVKMLLSEGFHVTVTYSSDVIAAEQSLEGLKEFEDMLCFVQADQGCYEDMRRVVSHMMSLGYAMRVLRYARTCWILPMKIGNV